MEKQITELALHIMKEAQNELIEKIECMPDHYKKKDIIKSLRKRK